MESGQIPDSDISASSSYARSVGPEHARWVASSYYCRYQNFIWKRDRRLTSRRQASQWSPKCIELDQTAPIIRGTKSANMDRQFCWTIWQATSRPILLSIKLWFVQSSSRERRRSLVSASGYPAQRPRVAGSGPARSRAIPRDGQWNPRAVR